MICRDPIIFSIPRTICLGPGVFFGSSIGGPFGSEGPGGCTGITLRNPLDSGGSGLFSTSFIEGNLLDSRVPMAASAQVPWSVGAPEVVGAESRRFFLLVSSKKKKPAWVIISLVCEECSTGASPFD
ncbi:unnamed protein product [Cuscuta campestris]|uniref:Uncharacterized protein n=1 Tax=Cuscuta campestris TaxID=132261 RepID=A0A484M2T6_9ASTE|nr:unnamed protein product [Cuscuta campestris]